MGSVDTLQILKLFSALFLFLIFRLFMRWFLNILTKRICVKDNLSLVITSWTPSFVGIEFILLALLIDFLYFINLENIVTEQYLIKKCPLGEANLLVGFIIFHFLALLTLVIVALLKILQPEIEKKVILLRKLIHEKRVSEGITDVSEKEIRATAKTGTRRFMDCLGFAILTFSLVLLFAQGT